MGLGNDMGMPVPVEKAEDQIFGMVLLNDWSARDIQKWEMAPLGPFNSKNWVSNSDTQLPRFLPKVLQDDSERSSRHSWTWGRLLHLAVQVLTGKCLQIASRFCLLETPAYHAGIKHLAMGGDNGCLGAIQVSFWPQSDGCASQRQPPAQTAAEFCMRAWLGVVQLESADQQGLAADRRPAHAGVLHRGRRPRPCLTSKRQTGTPLTSAWRLPSCPLGHLKH